MHSLHQDDLILIVFDGQENITPALETIWTVTVTVIARETGVGGIAGTVNLKRENGCEIHSQVQTEQGTYICLLNLSTSVAFTLWSSHPPPFAISNFA